MDKSRDVVANSLACFASNDSRQCVRILRGKETKIPHPYRRPVANPMSYIRNHNGKRSIEAIDLTGSDDAPWESLPQKNARPTLTGGQPQTQRDTWAASALTGGPMQSQRDAWAAPPSTDGVTESQREVWNDEDDADNVIVLSQDGDNSAMESCELYGT